MPWPKPAGILLMVSNDQELQATLKRVKQFQLQVANLRRVERGPENWFSREVCPWQGGSLAARPNSSSRREGVLPRYSASLKEGRGV